MIGDEMAAAPVFVLGTMRSGSTLLRLMLDAHPAIAIDTETGFMRAAQAIETPPNFQLGAGWYEHYGLTRAELYERIARFYDEIFSANAARHGKPRWGEKTPMHTRYIADMAAMYPRAVFVAIVRHPGAMASSLYKWNYSLPEALDRWTAANTELVTRGAELGDRFAIVRYEDLVARPEQVMREVVAHVGEPWSPEVLEHHATHGNDEIVEGGTNASDPLDPSRAWSFLAKSDDATFAAIRAHAGELLGWFGYRVDSNELDPFAPDARSIASGTDLSSRFASRTLATAGRESDDDDADVEAQLLATRKELERLHRQKSVRFARAVSISMHARNRRELERAWATLRGQVTG